MIHTLDPGEPDRGLIYVLPSGRRVTYCKADSHGALCFRYVGDKVDDVFWLRENHFYAWVKPAPVAVRVPE
jgi:hypothetical protein